MDLINFTGVFTLRRALLCSALVVPALTPVTVFAQEQAAPCRQLQDAGGQINFEQSNITEDEFRQVVESNDPQQCETWLTRVNAQISGEGEVAETQRARVRLEDEVVIEGRVIIDHQQPSIQIEEQAPEVTVGRTTPDVNVTQAPMDIMIRQDAPRITLDMPQPTITIEQPAPEIIVTMPDPSVDVGNTRPQIEVRQAEPRVQVSMPEPTVELDLYQATDPENSPGLEISQRQSGGGTDGAAAEPEVTMRRAEAQIVYQDGGQDQQQANVSFSRSEPNIRFEQAEPQIEVSSSGEPQINWSRTGEARVSFRDSAEQDGSGQSASGNTDEASNAAPGQQASQESGQQQPQQAATDQAQNRPPAVRRDGYTGVEAEQVAATDLQGAVLYGVQGEEIGEIGELVMSREEAQMVVAEIGGAMGIEERRVEIPFSDLAILQAEESDDIRVYIDANEERLRNYPEAE